MRGKHGATSENVGALIFCSVYRECYANKDVLATSSISLTGQLTHISKCLTDLFAVLNVKTLVLITGVY